MRTNVVLDDDLIERAKKLTAGRHGWCRNSSEERMKTPPTASQRREFPQDNRRADRHALLRSRPGTAALRSGLRSAQRSPGLERDPPGDRPRLAGAVPGHHRPLRIWAVGRRPGPLAASLPSFSPGSRHEVERKEASGCLRNGSAQQNKPVRLVRRKGHLGQDVPSATASGALCCEA